MDELDYGFELYCDAGETQKPIALFKVEEDVKICAEALAEYYACEFSAKAANREGSV